MFYASRTTTDQSTVDSVRAALTRMRERKLRWHFGRESILHALERLKRGGVILVTDESHRENEGDFITAAELTTPDAIAYIVRKSSGVLCAPMYGTQLDRLELPQMMTKNEDRKETAFTVSVDYKDNSTGISAQARCRTFRALADPAAQSSDFTRPGHVFPLRARPGGVLSRGGHTEASLDLLRLAGMRYSVAVIAEVVSEWNPVDMARLDELKELANADDLPLTSVEDLRCYLLEKMFGLRIEV